MGKQFVDVGKWCLQVRCDNYSNAQIIGRSAECTNERGLDVQDVRISARAFGT